MNNHQKEGTRRGEHEVGRYLRSIYLHSTLLLWKSSPHPQSGQEEEGTNMDTLLFFSHGSLRLHRILKAPVTSCSLDRPSPVLPSTDNLRHGTSTHKDAPIHNSDTKRSTIRTSHSAGNGLLHGSLSVRRKHPPPNAGLQFPNDNPPFFLFPQGPSSRLVNPKKAPPSSSHVFFFFTTPLLHRDSLPHAFFFFTLSKGSLAYHSATISSTH
ncbi:hypothetical protein GQ607_003001 [Colletotrichum asianum]|uniref:Uncharacterized protein n=1 Tax=Colletotrichum asianum TaxID=702518 RepID=A0A8H3ZS62_9PEZI|nr:hypothetical protein GQ607_003001 [Colletotrichum asianum]